MVNFVCRYSIISVSDYTFPKKGQDTEYLSGSLPGRSTSSLAFSGFLHNPGRPRELVDIGYRLRWPVLSCFPFLKIIFQVKGKIVFSQFSDTPRVSLTKTLQYQDKNGLPVQMQTNALAKLGVSLPLDPGNLPALDLWVVNRQVVTPSHASPRKVNTKPSDSVACMRGPTRAHSGSYYVQNHRSWMVYVLLVAGGALKGHQNTSVICPRAWEVGEHVLWAAENELELVKYPPRAWCAVFL
ncbi:hypothetical protein CRG98_026822 [Punica granatum]|uniref:Uncharacterized protein n=1 Tax=Punica granatum TaxID=22663 RepID=A0A2I0J975_PUNGR|nr:hypothetical protein CRG98_026822 [Punica granatum]